MTLSSNTSWPISMPNKGHHDTISSIMLRPATACYCRAGTQPWLLWSFKSAPNLYSKMLGSVHTEYHCLKIPCLTQLHVFSVPNSQLCVAADPSLCTTIIQLQRIPQTNKLKAEWWGLTLACKPSPFHPCAVAQVGQALHACVVGWT